MSERLDDGHGTLIEFSANPAVKLWEKSVTPPGISGGGANDTTTMRNTQWRTLAPKKLKSMTQTSFSAAYDPEVYEQLNNMINVNQLIIITFPDGSQVRFWGWLDEFTPGDITEGEQPTADCTIQCSNQNTSGAEVAPVYYDVDEVPGASAS